MFPQMTLNFNKAAETKKWRLHHSSEVANPNVEDTVSYHLTDLCK